MEDQNLNSNDDNSFYYIFHSPLEKVYNVFKNPSLHFYLFFPKLSLNNIKSNTPLDEVGSEYTLESTSKDKYVFVVENVIDLPLLNDDEIDKDNMHPNDKGYTKISKFIEGVINGK